MIICRQWLDTTRCLFSSDQYQHLKPERHSDFLPVSAQAFPTSRSDWTCRSLDVSFEATAARAKVKIPPSPNGSLQEAEMLLVDQRSARKLLALTIPTGVCHDPGSGKEKL